MYHFHNFGQSLKFRGGADSWESREESAQIGGKGLIAFRGRVRTNTTEVSTGCTRAAAHAAYIPMQPSTYKQMTHGGYLSGVMGRSGFSA